MPEPIKRRKGYRLLEIQGQTWQWMMGKTCVNIIDPFNKSTQVPKTFVSEEQNTRCEACGDYECEFNECDTVDVAIPKLVARYIRLNLVTV